MAGPVFVSTAMAYGGAGAVPLPIVNLDYANGQRVAASTTSARSTAINASLVLVKSLDSDFYFRVGDNTVVAAIAGTSIPVMKGDAFYVPITPGQQVAVILPAGSGAVHVTPCV